MFEDSTFESTGRIRTRSRGWMIAATLVNSSILLALILVPLIYPEAISRHELPFLVAVPVPPPTQDPPPAQQLAHPAQAASPQMQDPYAAPQRIPRFINIPDKPDQVAGPVLQSWEQPTGIPGGIGPSVPGPSASPIVRLVPKAPVRVSGLVSEGLLLSKTLPIYPRLAIVVRAEGTVVLQATISKDGTIENLRAVSGPPMLQQAAIDAVKTWRYRPYLLGGEPVEVETTVNVVFTLGH